MWDTRSLRFRDGEIEAPGGGTPAGATRIVLLIHGYNNDKDEAEDSYRALTVNVSRTPTVRDQIWKFFWPSYVDRLTSASVSHDTSLQSRYSTAGTESNSVLSMPTYALQVLKAPAVGRALGRYLRDLARSAAIPTEIVLVAHSLGCRVALEALRGMLEGSDIETERLRVPCVCLMAAAIPTFMVAEGARLGEAAMLPQASYILHSPADLVLRLAFPGGQGAASILRKLSGLGGDADAPDTEDDEGWWPEAVGRHGNPTGLWLRRANTGLGHSEYWQHPSTAPSVLQALGAGGPEQLRSLPTLQQITWTLPEYPALPDWRTRGARDRQITGRVLFG